MPFTVYHPQPPIYPAYPPHFTRTSRSHVWQGKRLTPREWHLEGWSNSIGGDTSFGWSKGWDPYFSWWDDPRVMIERSWSFYRHPTRLTSGYKKPLPQRFESVSYLGIGVVYSSVAFRLAYCIQPVFLVFKIVTKFLLVIKFRFHLNHLQNFLLCFKTNVWLWLINLSFTLFISVSEAHLSLLISYSEF